MARYTGPRVRISRRFGIPIFGPTKYLERRNYGPGVHGRGEAVDGHLTGLGVDVDLGELDRERLIDRELDDERLAVGIHIDLGDADGQQLLVPERLARHA